MTSSDLSWLVFCPLRCAAEVERPDLFVPSVNAARLERFWHDDPDRRFQTEMYRRLSQFNTVLDIGARNYNRHLKALINSTTTLYYQLEPYPPAVMRNDGLLHCTVQESARKYPQHHNFFDVVLDFGTYAWDVIEMPTASALLLYLRGLWVLLKEDGVLSLKLTTRQGTHDQRRAALDRTTAGPHALFDYLPSFMGHANGVVTDPHEGRYVLFLRKRSLQPKPEAQLPGMHTYLWSTAVCRAITQMLSVIHKVAQAYGIWYTAVRGTALAAWRHRGGCMDDPDGDVEVRSQHDADVLAALIARHIVAHRLPWQVVPNTAHFTAGNRPVDAEEGDPWYTRTMREIPHRIFPCGTFGMPYFDIWVGSAAHFGLGAEAQTAERLPCRFGGQPTWCPMTTLAGGTTEDYFHENYGSWRAPDQKSAATIHRLQSGQNLRSCISLDGHFHGATTTTT